MAGRDRAGLRIVSVPTVMKQSGCSCAPSPNSSRIRTFRIAAADVPSLDLLDWQLHAIVAGLGEQCIGRQISAVAALTVDALTPAPPALRRRSISQVCTTKAHCGSQTTREKQMA